MSKNIKKLSKDKIKQSNKSEYSIDYKPGKYHSAFLNAVNKDARSSRPETVGKLATEIFPDYIDNAATLLPKVGRNIIKIPIPKNTMMALQNSKSNLKKKNRQLMTSRMMIYRLIMMT